MKYLRKLNLRFERESISVYLQNKGDIFSFSLYFYMKFYKKDLLL